MAVIILKDKLEFIHSLKDEGFREIQPTHPNFRLTHKCFTRTIDDALTETIHVGYFIDPNQPNAKSEPRHSEAITWTTVDSNKISEATKILEGLNRRHSTLTRRMMKSRDGYSPDLREEFKKWGKDYDSFHGKYGGLIGAIRKKDHLGRFVYLWDVSLNRNQATVFSKFIVTLQKWTIYKGKSTGAPQIYGDDRVYSIFLNTRMNAIEKEDRGTEKRLRGEPYAGYARDPLTVAVRETISAVKKITGRTISQKHLDRVVFKKSGIHLRDFKKFKSIKELRKAWREEKFIQRRTPYYCDIPADKVGVFEGHYVEEPDINNEE